ncbi:MAG: glycoside hydrolase family 2 [Sporichthyaceae bacterium]|nr:glycoside hydrolase family 2 [Sporichthyaceae bacterium]
MRPRTSGSGDHPRPQLTRERWTDLAGTWKFAHDDDDVGIDEGWADRPELLTTTIQVPFPPESPASGIGVAGFHPVVWYSRSFQAAHRPGERLLLHFGAVDYRASVWVNGRLVVTHEGGHTPFSADITPMLVPEAEQVVTVRAEDQPTDLTQPRGKQDWREQPHSVWYERTTGIWQPVWLEPVPATRIELLRWTPDLDRAVLALRAQVRGHDPSSRIRVRLTLRDELVAEDIYPVTGSTTTHFVALDPGRIAHDGRAYLWAPDHHNLFDATVTMLSGDEVVDEVTSYVGLRSVDVSRGRFRLNHRAMVLRMVLAQNYWPQSHLAAPGAEALRREVELVKELGFNGVRIHQKIEDPRFLYWCDVLGLLAWTELPSALTFDTATVSRLTREWLEVLDRDASSPSVVAWVPFNESWGVPSLESDPAQQHTVRALYSLTKAIDPTRPVIANDGWEHLVSDIFGIHDYSQEADALRERYGSREAAIRTLRETQPYYRSIALGDVELGDAPLMITEFGGVTYDPDSDAFWNGYGAVDDPDQLATRYNELVTALLDSPVVAGFCYTQLTDTAQERNGLLYEDRRPKVDPEVIARTNRRASAAVPADAIAEIQIVHAAQIAQRADPAETEG